MSLLEQEAPAPPREPVPARRRVLRILVGLALLVSVGARLHSQSALWLDEALTVNIARLPLSDLPAALRQDGAPPLYYLLLHGWMALFGTGSNAVRALSGLFGVAAIPLAWLAARRLRDERTAWTAALLFGASPFLVRYSSENRMYAMVVVLVLLGVLALEAALREPALRRLWPVSLLAGLLMLTHYWSLYLLTVVGGVLIARSFRSRAARRCLVALAAGGLLFVPWLPTFLFQSEHTGTPWILPPPPYALLDTLNTWTGGPTLAGGLLSLLLVGLVVVALVGRGTPDGVLLSGRLDPRTALLAGVGVGTVALGLVLAHVSTAGYAPRYSSGAVVPFLLAAAAGAGVLPPRARTAVVGVAVVCGLVGSVKVPLAHTRTEAALVARALRPALQPTDLVVYCPDQNGPAVSRLLPAGTRQVVYPTLGPPERIDWVDYAQRNAQADPQAFARTVLTRTSGTIWLVSRGGFRTFGTQCEDLRAALRVGKGSEELVVGQVRQDNERFDLRRYPASSAARATP